MAITVAAIAASVVAEEAIDAVNKNSKEEPKPKEAKNEDEETDQAEAAPPPVDQKGTDETPNGTSVDKKSTAKTALTLGKTVVKLGAKAWNNYKAKLENKGNPALERWEQRKRSRAANHTVADNGQYAMQNPTNPNHRMG